MEWNYKEKKLELIEAAKDAYDILVESLKEPIDLSELGDDKIRAAIQAKKVALFDARDFLKEIEDLERSAGTLIDGANLTEKKTWDKGFAEKNAK